MMARETAILVLNAGSSSLKFAIHGAEPGLPRQMAGAVDGIGSRLSFRARDGAGQPIAAPEPAAGSDAEDALDFLLDWLDGANPRPLGAVGHRVVHGGAEFARPVRVTPDILARLEALAPLAPLHQPQNLRPIRLIAARRPALPQVACFDTAFHATMPRLARAFALPSDITERGIRRYGFHGLSYEYIAGRLPGLDARAAAGRTIVLHLGHGASLCALAGGQSVATTMGFTALDGLPMGTRCGSLDPGVVLHLQRALGLSPDAVEDLLYRRSGLLGLSGLSGDVRDLLASDTAAAREALALFVYAASRAIGSLAAALGGLDALVFTAGIGENAAEIRAGICTAAGWLGVAMDPQANAAPAAGARRISLPDSPVAVWVVPTDEDLMIARHTAGLLGQAAGDPTD